MSIKILREEKKILFAILFLSLFWCGIYKWWTYEYPSATWRYKLTVMVETPDGIKTGSAVREVYSSAHPGFMGVSAGVSHSVKGEAVVIDLGQEKYLFNIMDVDGSYRIVRDAFPFPYEAKRHGDYIRYYASLKGKREIGTDDTMFVTFKDMKDPKTVIQADPDNLEKTFGKGIKFQSITIEMTDEPLTRKISSYLPSYGEDTHFWEWHNKLEYSDYRYHIGPQSFH